MSVVIGTAVIVSSEDDIDTVELKLSSEFMECSLAERIGALYMLIDQIYDLMDYDSDEESDEDEDEEDELDMDHFA